MGTLLRLKKQKGVSQMNKDGRIFGKINIIDLLAALILIVALVGIGIRFTSSASKSVTDNTEFSYVVEIILGEIFI